MNPRSGVILILPPIQTLGNRISVLLVFGLLSAATGFAQDVRPRAFTPAPVGLNAVSVGVSYSSGELLFDKTIPVEDVHGDVYGIGPAYSRTFGVLGISGRADFALPIVSGDWIGDLTLHGIKNRGETRSITGIADPIIGIVFNLVGAPAKPPGEFVPNQPGTIVTGIWRMKVPLGQYDPTKAINLGSNRWAFGPNVVVSHLAGRLLVEGHAGMWLFTDNNEFLVSSTVKQDPLYAFQLHVGYLTRRGWWVAVSTRQSFGGATQRDDHPKTDSQTNNRVGLTLSIPVARYSVKVFVTTGLSATVGNDYNTLGAALSILL